MSEKVVLLVEDNPDDIDLTLRSFEQHHIANKIIVAKNGADALDYLFCRGAFVGREPDNPVVVLLDLKLPKVDGLEVLRQIRATAATQTIPVVILTTSNEENDRLASYKAFANSYVRKPVDFDQFLHAVRQLGIYWLLLNEAPAQP
jgi:two-component system response regulator